MPIDLRKREPGLTLVELVVALAIASLVLVLAVPPFVRLIATTRMTGAANGLLANLQFARMEAVTRNARVAVCPSVDGDACDAAKNPQSWSGGYIVALVDNEATPKVLQVLRREDSGELRGLAVHSAGRPRFRFEGDGSTVGDAGSVWILDPTDSHLCRQVVVNDVGRSYVSAAPVACPP